MDNITAIYPIVPFDPHIVAIPHLCASLQWNLMTFNLKLCSIPCTLLWLAPVCLALNSLAIRKKTSFSYDFMSSPVYLFRNTCSVPEQAWQWPTRTENYATKLNRIMANLVFRRNWTLAWMYAISWWLSFSRPIGRHSRNQFDIRLYHNVIITQL